MAKSHTDAQRLLMLAELLSEKLQADGGSIVVGCVDWRSKNPVQNQRDTTRGGGVSCIVYAHRANYFSTNDMTLVEDENPSKVDALDDVRLHMAPLDALRAALDDALDRKGLLLPLAQSEPKAPPKKERVKVGVNIQNVGRDLGF